MVGGDSPGRKYYAYYLSTSPGDINYLPTNGINWGLWYSHGKLQRETAPGGSLINPNVSACTGFQGKRQTNHRNLAVT
jgi:hypothetical protein